MQSMQVSLGHSHVSCNDDYSLPQFMTQVSGGFLQTAQTWSNAAVCPSLELVSPPQVTHLRPCVGSFTSPDIDTRQKGPPAL